jgi:DNA repair protein RadA/Sms
MRDDVQRLREVDVAARFHRRLSFGSDPLGVTLDRVFGGEEHPGVVPGTSVLFTGQAGGGKSTTALTMADRLQRAGGNVLYVSAEESREMVRLRADRLRLEASFQVSEIVDALEFAHTCRRERIAVAFVDSIQAMRIPGLSGAKMLLEIARIARELGREGITTFLVGQAVKSGNFAGPEALRHEVDVAVQFSIETGTGKRNLVATKNRYGPSFVPVQLEMKATGLELSEAAPEQRTSPPPEATRTQATARPPRLARTPSRPSRRTDSWLWDLIGR